MFFNSSSEGIFKNYKTCLSVSIASMETREKKTEYRDVNPISVDKETKENNLDNNTTHDQRSLPRQF